MKRFSVLSTKKLKPKLVQELNGNGIDVQEEEFISIEPVRTEEKFREILQSVEREVKDASAKEQKRAVFVFTSANAAEILGQYLSRRDCRYQFDADVFCLSGKTKEAAETHVLSHIREGAIRGSGPHAAALAEKILEADIRSVLLFCGERRRDELPQKLKAAGIRVQEIVLYRTRELPARTTEAVDAVLFFSPSAVHSFFSVNGLSKETACFAIGQTTAAAIADYTDNQVIVSKSPDQETMLASVLFYFKNINYHE